MVELGISTFGEITELEGTGQTYSHAERIRQLVAEIELADKVGLDVYGIGEHQRADFAVSAPEIVLAAGAVNTKKIRLTSAVSILSSMDPIRLFQQYATIDALSNGRSEIMAGRGSFTESFPLFGYDLKDYDSLFDEKLDLLQLVNEKTKLDWQGRLTQTIAGKEVYPRPVQDKLPLWIATGGHVESTVKIAQAGLPIVYAIIGGNPRYFKKLIQAYREIGSEAGHADKDLKVGAHSWGWIAEDGEQAVKDYFHPTKQVVDAISKDRPHWQELRYEQYLEQVGPNGAMFVGNPDQVAEKLIRMIEDLGLDRFMLHLPLGSMPHDQVLRAIELFGTQVAPKVRAYFAMKEA
ncbi:coenzyme F420-dependent N5,N10-methylene tetrahydromethanopterin reductase-like protein [Streptococcus pneumoniae]|nr:coenzyme F420-dependent N5,N10-methylene tetrahydromethanopterin reductase-like protein [Streptococcus pneumoniae]VOI18201.1 coenzyme F420-dependent N5,N10-methylene tetrahydromethanopterin reductase-like protein [Streptococcus pneumoniae]VTD33692.1 coenzyme F420-dependent N5,N10-methylene tetrahydromethanopterin reductase-like protein [Streptococcus pneumoniae]HEU3751997.1 LLM class flavin-dependent oxidoreductase [Streptococcus pneumoniae]HEU3753848.1 LLM class flavin-dependent oxidoreduct